MNHELHSYICNSITRYTQDTAQRVVKSDFDELSRIIMALLAAKESGNSIFTAGNGGSGATASHMANDFTKGCRAHNREGFKIECLVDSSAVITCLANDFSYEDIFSIQLKTKARPGDVLVVFSGSGNSSNIVRAVEIANEMGVVSIGFSGRDGGKLKGLCHLLMISPTYSMEQLEDMHMLYEHAMACTIRQILEDSWGMEVVRYPSPSCHIQSALFDFDGTVSLIREGWQDIMIPYFIEILSATPKAEEPNAIAEIVGNFVDTLTGKQTIFQCIRLAEEVEKRGGPKVNPLAYKKEYLKRLFTRIENRHADLKQGASPERYLVPGIIDLLKELKKNGIRCYLASGTDEPDVLAEAELLGVVQYFDGGIYGAKDDITECAKEAVIHKIIQENNISGNQLVSFGDGFVEIELVAGIGGYTFGVATDEVRRKGINQHKRQRLLSAGAHAIIPDFTGAKKIVAFIKGEGNNAF